MIFFKLAHDKQKVRAKIFSLSDLKEAFTSSSIGDQSSAANLCPKGNCGLSHKRTVTCGTLA